MANRFIDLTGKKYGRLTVLRYVGRDAFYQSIWECICECGTVKTFFGYNLKKQERISCGCLQSENAKRTIEVNGKPPVHGMAGTVEYSIWNKMKYRCYNPLDKYFKDYGGKGIVVCERWKNNFSNFYKDMGPRPSIYHTIDRYPNQRGNYEPGNCRWATQKEQQNNRTNNHVIEYNGEKLTITQWSEKTGIKRTTIQQRIRNYGYTVEEALTS